MDYAIFLGFITEKEGYRKGYYRLTKRSLLYKKLEMDTKIRSQKISTKGRKLQNVCVCKNKTLLKNAGERDPGYSCYNACIDNEPKAYQCKEK